MANLSQMNKRNNLVDTEYVIESKDSFSILYIPRLAEKKCETGGMKEV